MLRRFLSPGWPDEARRIVQERVFRGLTRATGLRGRCLNAGCGEGLYSPFLESFAAVTRIVDMDLGNVPRAPNDRHVCARASLTELPFADRSFDSCLCSEVLEHIPDDGRALSELARVLRPGGLLLVSVPSPPAPPDREHVREGYRQEDLAPMLEAAGFEVVASEKSFHVFMRLLARTWEWQFEHLGGRRRSFFPSFLVRLLGHADRLVPLGKPWDLALLARKRERVPLPLAKGADRS